MIHGPTGVGKTHLLEGIWTAAKRRHPRLHAVYLSAEQFTSYFLEALHTSGVPNFRNKYRGVDLLLVDDLQFFAGKRATLGELLHTIDALDAEGRQLVFAADRSPAVLAGLGPELVARLSAGLVCRIEPPDFETRRGILRGQAARLELELSDEVLDFVAGSFRDHARELQGALLKLHATSRAPARPVTLALAEEALADSVVRARQPVKLADVQQAVCARVRDRAGAPLLVAPHQRHCPPAACWPCGWHGSTRGRPWPRSANSLANSAAIRPSYRPTKKSANG